MKRFIYFIFLFLSTQAFSSYTFMLQPNASFLYTYDRHSSVVTNVSVDIDIFFIDFIGRPPVYLPPEIQKDGGQYSYKDLQRNLLKAEKSSGIITIFNEGDQIGRIEQDFYTSNGAKFILYDQNDEAFALAYLDKAYWHLTLVDINDKELEIAYLHKYHQTQLQGMTQRFFYGWKVEVQHDTMVDPAMLLFFSAFLGDTYWDEFRRPIGQPHWTKD